MSNALAATATTSEQDLLDLSLEELATINVSTASRFPEPITKTAASVSVITQSDIERFNARTIYDVLRQLPGLTVGSGQFGENFVSVRGVRSVYSEKILFLLNGHQFNDNRSGSATYQFLDHLPVNNISRIEVVRSPASAQYGANAFLAVINIITKQPLANDHEAKAELALESQQSASSNISYYRAATWTGNWRGNVNIHYRDDAGADIPVDADAFGRSGNASTWQRYVDIQPNLINGGFSMHGRYFKRSAGDFFGAANVLNDDSKQQVEAYFVDASYRRSIQENTLVNVRGYVDHQRSYNYYMIYPPGTLVSIPALNAWNDSGYIGAALAKETTIGVESHVEVNLNQQHISGGVGYRDERLHDTETLSNANPGFLTEVINVTDSYNWLDPVRRRIFSAYVQDLWDRNNSQRITGGLRYDKYSDHGDSLSPRIGLTHKVSKHSDLRVFYASAFRAPDFVSQGIKNNPLLLGNKDLQAEKIHSIEIGYTSVIHSNWLFMLTTFNSRLINMIDQSSESGRYENIIDARVWGLEVDNTLEFTHKQFLGANLSYSRLRYHNGHPYAIGPKTSMNLYANLNLTPVLAWNSQIHSQSSTERNRADARNAIAGFTSINTHLNYDVSLSVKLAFSVFNVTNQQIFSPSSANSGIMDYPEGERSFALRLSKKL